MLVEKDALVLVSGGLDSLVLLSYLTKVYPRNRIMALTYDYGQKNVAEIRAAEDQTHFFGISDHIVADASSLFDPFRSNSALLTPRVEIPKGLTPFLDGLPATYVPGRNLVFLAGAVSFALSENIPNIYVAFIAAHSPNPEFRGYPDAGIEFLQSLQETVFLLGGVLLHAPFADFDKTQVTRLGLELGAPFDMSLSCFDPVIDDDHPEAFPRACGQCDACAARLAAFEAIGTPDHAPYVALPAV